MTELRGPSLITTNLAVRIAEHKKWMLSLCALALMVIVGFTLLPGRLMYQVVFG